VDRIVTTPPRTLTFVLTDVVGSTRLWDVEPDKMRLALVRHDRLIEDIVAAHHGSVVRPRGEGDSRFAVFVHAAEAVAAAAEIQRRFWTEPWPTSRALRVRIGLHTGIAELRDGDYYGSDVNRCARVRAIAHGGQVLLTARAAGQAATALPGGVTLEGLGQHRLGDLSRPERIYQLVVPEIGATFPPPMSLDNVVTNLPAETTSFVEREREVKGVKRAVQASRLVTLTCAGGLGKTRLALRVAGDLIDDFEDGVWLMELALFTDPLLVAHAMAGVFRVPEQPGRSLADGVCVALRPKQVLIVLDNCEHLIEACAEIADMLVRTCPYLQILATSRQPLDVAGETVWRIPPLSLPSSDRDSAKPVDLMSSEAAQLFVDRAVAVDADFVLSDGNGAAVAEICRQLDGMPLAIELAAARLRALAPQQIASRLADRFRLLARTSSVASGRQQTLRALVDWSYELLSAQERRLFERLEVFAGGWTIEAAEAVCGGEDLAPVRVLPLLVQLVEKSLVLAEATRSGVMRYRFLETVRQYAAERLRASDTAGVVRSRHAAFFAELAESGDPDHLYAYDGAWIDQVEQEHDNVRSALRWCLTSGTPDALDIGIRIARGAMHFWYVRGYISEARAWLDEFTSAAQGTKPSVAYVNLLTRGGDLCRAQAEYRGAMSVFTRALEIATQLDYVQGASAAHNGLGVLAAQAGQFALAEAEYDEALRLAEGHQLQTCFVLIDMGDLALARGLQATATEYYERSADIQRRIGNRHGLAVSLSRLGKVALDRGEFAVSRRYAEGSAKIRLSLGGRRFACISLFGLAQWRLPKAK
jgi:predicted ATPase/class 3 adenylate cyclase